VRVHICLCVVCFMLHAVSRSIVSGRVVEFARVCVRRILSLYSSLPKSSRPTSVVLVGHSMVCYGTLWYVVVVFTNQTHKHRPIERERERERERCRDMLCIVLQETSNEFVMHKRPGKGIKCVSRV